MEVAWIYVNIATYSFVYRPFKWIAKQTRTLQNVGEEMHRFKEKTAHKVLEFMQDFAHHDLRNYPILFYQVYSIFQF